MILLSLLQETLFLLKNSKWFGTEAECCAPTEWCDTPRIWAKEGDAKVPNEKITKLAEQAM